MGAPQGQNGGCRTFLFLFRTSGLTRTFQALDPCPWLTIEEKTERKNVSLKRPAFESAKTKEEMLDAFKKMESAFKKLANLKVGLGWWQEVIAHLRKCLEITEVILEKDGLDSRVW
ncbi:hypothetical protein FH972_027300 [Carpinus fangiana]|uniref:Uncharacterized protein n=1 Tax=Carpinus fangiana TaxID=176857 RepID=A0A5N6M8Q0_9ROSI|nr:hypothetical protein FH972_027300 [Carpinus fangiana]